MSNAQLASILNQDSRQNLQGTNQAHRIGNFVINDHHPNRHGYYNGHHHDCDDYGAV